MLVKVIKMLITNSAKKKELKNNILALAAQAKAAKKEDALVVNATTGMLKNEDDTLYEFDSVINVIKSLNVDEKFAYANSCGSPTYTQAVLFSLFGKYLDDIRKGCCLDCLPTPGGSGALNLAFTNYVERGETVLLPNHMWENYLSYGIEMGFNSDTYCLFNDKGNFNIEDLTERISIIKKHQKRIFILINDPCENPTGFCMKEEDYDSLLDLSKNNQDLDFVYLMDVAYYDFYNANPDICVGKYHGAGIGISHYKRWNTLLLICSTRKNAAAHRYDVLLIVSVLIVIDTSVFGRRADIEYIICHITLCFVS